MALRAHRHAEVRHFLRASGATAYVIPRCRRRLRLPGDGRAQMRAEFPGIEARDRGRRTGTWATARWAACSQGRRDRVAGTVDPADVGDDAAVGRHDVDVEADPAHARRLRAQRAAVRRRRRASTSARCSWPSCRSGTTTTWPRPACWARSTTAAPWCSPPARAPTRSSRLVQRERVTVIAAVVPLITTWLNSDAPRRYDLSSLRGRAERRRAPGARAARGACASASAARRRRSTAPPRA